MVWSRCSSRDRRIMEWWNVFWFNFRDARDRIHEYRIPKARLATWTDDFEEIGPQQRP